MRLRPTARRTVAVMTICLGIAAGCAGPTVSEPAATAAPPATILATATAGLDPTPSPTPVLTPAPTCPPVDFVTFVASERLSEASVVPGARGDLVGFVLVQAPGSQLRPRLTITSVEPPFSEGGSGQPLEVAGEHHILVRFEGMLHVDDAGGLVYTGLRDQPGIGGPVRQVRMTEAFESYVSFIIGFDSTGCVGLSVQPTLVTLSIAD